MNKEILEYQIATMRITDAFDIVNRHKEEGQTKFEHMVNDYMTGGWQPFGAPFVILDQKWQQINQPMVKYAGALETYMNEHGYEFDQAKESVEKDD